ncbi:MAG: hypothetical protein JXR46_05620 [Calditrichaceae bacterium]|nr:hypothetical protein [Calditrichaceae bacterium]MBN2708505.1 hypothetical protein [Calditrichaceae bacterium]RQV96025.1 MAG: hypothetical protein EH224_05875 [Calditrichota bacterium]
MNRTIVRIIYLSLFSVAMAYLESAVVVYLRFIYYPETFDLSVFKIPPEILTIEIGREAATLVMLVALAWIAAREFKTRFAGFIFCFGVWDLFYYIWLKVFINWPEYWLEWDILFLIPTAWLAPWLVPVIISIFMIICSTLVFIFPERFEKYIFNLYEWLIVLASMLIILYTFLYQTGRFINGQIPETYPWLLFIIGVLLAISLVVRRIVSSGRKKI